MNHNDNKKIAVIGSRSIAAISLEKYLPPETNELVSGGSKGVDTVAKDYAIKSNLKLTEFLPNYGKYGRNAPLKRNISIIEYADIVFAFWDGKSRGTKYVIDNRKKMGIPVKVFIQRLNGRGVK